MHQSMIFIWLVRVCQYLSTQKLTKAHILLRCSETGHKNACAKLRDELLEKFNNIKNAQTVEAFGDTEDFCVAATAIINPENQAKFRRALQGLRSNSGKAKVDAVKIKLVQ